MSFRFKQFFIEDAKCAMKVGTDGVLLGAWCPTGTRILDVGTGSGLIARMLMQRCPEAEVEGIDIDAAAVEQACENGVRAFQARLQDWRLEIEDYYDLIVSNPPYFQNSLKNPDEGRKTARHTDTLPFAELVKHCARLLSEDGQLALILPAEAEAEVRQLAAVEGLYLTRVTRVYSKENKKPKRVLLAFQFQISNFLSQGNDYCKFQILEDALILEDEKGGRSAAYSELCREFYL
jgi:tRNA1Val (adenine37-N6)-methyltransferase